MYNEFSYNQVGYNYLEDKNKIYDTSSVGVDFGEGFKIPNQFVSACMIEYIEPITTSYDLSRITAEEQRVGNIKNETLSIKITGTIRAENRKELLTNIDYFKKKVRRKKEIIIKDFGVEKIGDVFIETIDFFEHHYNTGFMQFEIICTAYGYLAYNKTIKDNYSGITENNKKIVFQNSGLETDFIGILEIGEANNLDFIFSVNGIDLKIGAVNTGDLIVIDTKKIQVKNGEQEILFGGILEKLREGENEICIQDNGSSRNYNLSLFYKLTLS